MSPFTSPRQEEDLAEILSGVFEGVTTGAPISILIPNKNAESKHYEPIKEILRPGHAQFTYLAKYQIFDHRGGGRASARETAGRVAAGAIAKKLLKHFGIELLGSIKEIGGTQAKECDYSDLQALRRATHQSPLFCPDPEAAETMIRALTACKEEGDSLGGIVEVAALDLPPGLGDPIYEKLEANLAKAMLSLPASKGFEIGSGFAAARMRGSEHNDLFVVDQERIVTQTNFAGGTLAGISSGMPLICRVAFKPTSSILKVQKSCTKEGTPALLELPEGSRHDPCVAIRAVPVVEAMMALVLTDALLLNRSARV